MIPFALARRESDLPVDRQGELQGDPRAPEPQPRQPPGERFGRRLSPDSELHLDPSLAQPPDALARRARVWVLERNDHALRLGLQEKIGAGRSARAFIMSFDTNAALTACIALCRSTQGFQ